MEATFQNVLTLTSQFCFCGLPIRLDSYMGCSFGCNYCFARSRGGAGRHVGVRRADPASLGRILQRALARPPEESGVVGQFLHHRCPLHFGGMSDPFQPAEARFGVSRAFLEALAAHQYPVVISTKSDLVSRPDYLDLLRRLGPVVVQFSMCSTVDSCAKLFEGTASSPTELLRATEVLSNAGVPVMIRWQPYIPLYSEAPEVFIGRAAATGARHIGLEHLKVSCDSDATVQRSPHLELMREHYAALGALRDGREYVLPPEARLETVLSARSVCHTHGVTFGAADNDLQYLSDTGCCCSGVDAIPGFDNYFRHQIGHAVRGSSGRRITADLISRYWTPSGSVDRYLNSKSRLARQTGRVGSVEEHIRNRWNNPAASGSPASYYGVVATEEYTRTGYRVYEWQLPRSVSSALSWRQNR